MSILLSYRLSSTSGKSAKSCLSPLALAVSAVLVSQASNAAPTTKSDMPSMTAQTITVTAKRSVHDAVQKGAVNVDQYLPAQQASMLSDFLDAVPGVDVGGTSAITQRMQIRGMSDTDLKVTVDGARQEGYMFYHMGDITLDPDLLKQAEVAVGNNSVTLGNHALGGAVQFRTVDAADLLQPDQQLGGKVHVGYADNNDEWLTAATLFAAPTENVDLLAYFGRRDAKAGEDGKGDEIQTKDSKSENILLKAGAYITPDHHIKASFSRTENKGDYPLRPDFPMTQGDQSFNPIIPQEVKRDTYTFEYNFDPLNDLIDIDANLYQTKTEMHRNFDSSLKTTGGKIQNTSFVDSSFGSHNIITGVEHYKKESRFDGQDFGTRRPTHGTDEAKSTSVFLEDQWRLNNLTLTPGVRYDRYESPKYIADGKKYNNVVGALAASYDITPDTTVFASYTELFNGPNLGQVLYNRNGEDTFVSRHLKPEEGDNSEVGFTTTLRGLNTANDALQLSAKYFVTDLENYIDFVRVLPGGRGGIDCATGLPGGRCNGALNQDEEVRIKGGEVSATYSADNYNIGLSYARARSEGKETGYNLYRDTGDKVMLNLATQPSDEMEIGWRSTFVSSLTPKTVSNDPKKPSYDVHDVFMSYTPKQVKGLKATFGVYNLFDETYADHASRNLGTNMSANGVRYQTDYEPGRNFKAALTYQF